jgi:ferredoxin-NADP reductase
MLTTRFTNPAGSSFKDALRAMKIGDYIEGDSPEGDFVYSPNASQSVMIAGGIGITPYRSILLEMDHNDLPINATLLYANHDADFVFMTELDRLQLKYPDFHVYKYIGDQRIKSNEFSSYIKQTGTVFYISGPKKMVDNYQVLLDELAVPSEYIKLDYFPGYGVYNLQP